MNIMKGEFSLFFLAYMMSEGHFKKKKGNQAWQDMFMHQKKKKKVNNIKHTHRNIFMP